MPKTPVIHLSLCAEDITKTVIIPYLSGEDRQALEEEGVIPPVSSARDRFCVMCLSKEGLRDYLHVAYATTGVTPVAAIRLIWAEFVHVMFESLIQRGR